MQATTAAALARLGVDRDRVARLAERLRHTAPTLAAGLPELLAAAPDPLMAVAGCEGLVDASSDLSLGETLTAAERTALFTVLGSSQPLSTTLQAAGDGWIQLLRECCAAPPRTAGEHERELESAAALPWEPFADRLRQLRHREYLRIGLADLTGAYAVENTMAELSELATGTFRAAYRWARYTVGEQYGDLEAGPSPIEDAATLDSFVVLAMGKLGGGELNFSSDVDAMYLCGADLGHTTGGPRGVVEGREYFTRLAELITRALQEVTASGFVFRVDLRLRPDGINGPIVNPLADALVYYEAYGQTWERTALLQARPVAGSLPLGEQFLRELRPFVYRRYLDYSTVADMKEMKARVEAQLGQKARPVNVKLGRGGIREVEFIVQVLQLIHGGRDERLRCRGSLPTLVRLIETGYMPADEGEALLQAYRFLRNVEHKIQIVHQRQTHTVPTDAREQETLARRLGYSNGDAVARFWADMDRHTQSVRRAFEKLFYEPAAETRRAGDAEMVELVRTLERRKASIARLQALGFAHPEASYESLLLLREGPAAGGGGGGGGRGGGGGGGGVP
jgi:[glutamine synthetase] adenylyltransferase / [glutamine synthetase]-adenylyl-L-tyrosine phosphorylase